MFLKGPPVANNLNRDKPLAAQLAQQVENKAQMGAKLTP